MFYTYLFWTATVVFLVTSLSLAMKPQGTLFYVQVAAGLLMFVGSKIGREFLGL
jgi:hypothetical protein